MSEKKQIAKVTDKKQLVLTEIKETPFKHATNGERNYLICGKVLLEIDKNKEETEAWLQERPWEAIGVFIQATITEMTNEKK